MKPNPDRKLCPMSPEDLGVVEGAYSLAEAHALLDDVACQCALDIEVDTEYGDTTITLFAKREETVGEAAARYANELRQQALRASIDSGEIEKLRKKAAKLGYSLVWNLDLRSVGSDIDEW